MNKININPFFYFLALISVFTGLFKQFLIMYVIIIVHEFGHIFFALIFKYKIIKINIYPFGGYSIFQNDLNISFIKEFLVFLGGILFQFILYLIFKYNINNYSFIYKIFINYNTSIILFNLIPIIPLDGSKVINILLNNFISFKYAHLITIYILYIFVFILIVLFYNNLNMNIMILLLLFLLIKEHKIHKYLFNNFLVERLVKEIKFKKNNFINKLNLNKMMKYRNNIFIIDNRYISEKEILYKKYN